MSDKKEIKEGDLVTIALSEYQSVSNTYVVAKKLEGECVLSHPLAPECYIIKKDDALNDYFPTMQNSIEKCLFFAKKNKDCLGYSLASDLEALCYFFVIKKEFTPKQRTDLANICGKISSVLLGNNLSYAVTYIKQNQVLMDEYNHALFNSVKKILDDTRNLKTKVERYSIFNIAGFLLAQVSNS